MSENTLYLDLTVLLNLKELIMLSKKNLNQITKQGLTEQIIEQQLSQFKNGFPFLKLKAAASVEEGIVKTNDEQREYYINLWNSYKQGNKKIVKFVPASGAASRMFKDLFEYLDADYKEPRTSFEKTFCDNIKLFAFREELCDKCNQNDKKNIKGLIEVGDYKTIVRNLLDEKGLNYSNLPKGLLLFYNYEDGPRTAMEEHLAEGALYASSQGKVFLHFTVSHNHLDLFKKKVKEKTPYFENKFGVTYDISFSEQKATTDTIAVNLDNTPFLDEDDNLVFRPGGHGALIENLNDIDGDVIFIKNIDNVVPDSYKEDTVVYKQVLAGLLIELQTKIFNYLEVLEAKTYTSETLQEIRLFLEKELCCVKNGVETLLEEELANYLFTKLNRPIRICGVVRNQGEAGGGPFLVYNNDNTISLQILESSQIDKDNEAYLSMFKNGTHFNPVDLVCGTKDFKGRPFNLTNYVDKNTGFISLKSKNGKELKALELPGLWNGAMSDWNTVCVEVPLSTFNPVKTVNDLLKKS